MRAAEHGAITPARRTGGGRGDDASSAAARSASAIAAAEQVVDLVPVPARRRDDLDVLADALAAPGGGDWDEVDELFRGGGGG